MCVCFQNMSEQSKCVERKKTRTVRFASLCCFPCVHARAAVKLTRLVDVAQQLGDFDETGHRAL